MYRNPNPTPSTLPDIQTTLSPFDSCSLFSQVFPPQMPPLLLPQLIRVEQWPRSLQDLYNIEVHSESVMCVANTALLIRQLDSRNQMSKVAALLKKL